MVQYTSGTNKGETKQGDVFNDPFRLGKVDKNFTGNKVVDPVTLASGETEKEVTLAWSPVVGNKAIFIAEDGTKTELTVVDGKVTVTASGRLAYTYDNETIPQNDLPIVNAEIKSLPLVAHARRIAVYYSQIAAFQA